MRRRRLWRGGEGEEGVGLARATSQLGRCVDAIGLGPARGGVLVEGHPCMAEGVWTVWRVGQRAAVDMGVCYV